MIQKLSFKFLNEESTSVTFYFCGKTSWQNTSWEGKRFCGLRFLIAGHHWEEPGQELTRSNHEEQCLLDCCHCLLSLLSYITHDYLRRGGTACGVFPSSQPHINHQARKCPTDFPAGQSDRSHLNQVFFFLSSSYAKMTKTYPVQQER